ncbi:hypothetical protein BP5796_13049 [Coleophoma crateriformis]|uniref:WSC domain-containing protein n=1 Tax=Coleophoma crateriformis TaxID=565419 RepID=A0A3D8Q599_9HELO|nr:hypothetical protein BP5796_13049 [Coleophoma crateriformis]
MLSATVVLALATLGSAAKTSRTFAVNHFYGKGPLTMGRMDPIVNPGGPSGHVHAIQGGSNFALTMSDDVLLSSNCTSSLVKNDMSNYWTPSLYFQDPVTKELTNVEMFYMNVYYFFEATDDDIKAFEPGHRMVIGNPSLRSPPTSNGTLVLDPADGTIQPVQWTCPRSSTSSPLYPVGSDGLHGAGIQDPRNKGAGVGFPDQNCDGYASPLRADIHFPSCYNPAAGLDNYKENMQFPSSKGTASGRANCPVGWIHTPHLFFEVYWNTPKFAGQWTPGQGTQPFVLSNGDPTGYGLHADFISGWDVTTLQQIIDNCDAGDSGMDKCPGLIGGLNDASNSCNIANLVPETIAGTMAALPGNNPVTGWGSSGSSPVASSAAASPIATGLTSSSTKTAASTQDAVSVSVSSSATSAEGASSAATPLTTLISKPVVASTVSASPDSTSILTTSHTFSTTTALTTMYVSASATASSGGVFLETSPTSAVAATSTDAAGDAAGDDDACDADPVSTSSAPVSTPTTTSYNDTISNVTSPVSGWSYTGCYIDSTSKRVLSGIEFANVGQHAVTNTKCINYCSSRGYSISGTEYGGQCFCGDELSGSELQDDSACATPCEGDASQTCGGSASLSVFTSSVNGTATKTKRDAESEMQKVRMSRHLHKHLKH